MTDEQKEANGLIPPKVKVASPAGPSTVRMVRLKKPSEKTETSRIDLSAAESTELPEPSVKSGLNIKDVFGQPVMPAISSKPKAETSRVDLDQAEDAEAITQLTRDAALNRTARISLDEPPEAAVPSASKKPMDYTTHINLEGADMDETPFPSQTKEGTRRVTIDDLATALPKETASPQPIKTVRLQRPSSVPKTVVLSRPGAAPAEKPEPPATPPKMTMPEGSGSTSRIDVPPEAMEPSPATQRKTIRIKRPDGSPSGAGKTVTLMRQPKITLAKSAGAEEGDATATNPVLSKRAQDLLLNEMVDHTPGTAFSVMSLVAMLIAMALVYLLVADFMGFPLPGRLI